MNQLQVFENDLFKVSAKVESGEILFDVEEVAVSLGFTETKNGKVYVRWRTVNGYLKKYVSQDVAKGDLIPEPLVYKLAFKASNEVAEKFQDWLAIEVIPQIRKTGSYPFDTSQLSPELQMFSKLFNTVAKQELEQKRLENEIKQTNKRLDNVTTIVALNPKDWRPDVNRILNTIVKKSGMSYQDIRKESYELLEARAKCNLNIRLENKKKNALLEGASKSKASKINKMDVIESDKRLTEIYLAIVKEMAIKYQISMEGVLV
ncbi:hypothetical protein B4065_3313 [Caldibacillus thermoamylovorans]|uniref:BRO-N domain-containing protein n=1 Tax=Caldibacillus thermoamylovorans TaxID=35841 RepID=UPI0005B7199B|nr:BRO family protein [Caldibacillus thermoamylovorans]KIO62093.1 hypothetical protein B4065_3313 [Caldibacillus thermoamylovorans]